MKIEEQILRKYLHDIAIDQIAKDYASHGWKITRGEEIGKYHSDLVVRKAKKTIVFEIKAEKLSNKKKTEIERLTDEVKKAGYEFRLVLANPPKERDIEIVGIDHLFFEHFINETPEELTQLSSATSVNDVFEVEIDELIIDQGLISVKGKGIVSVTLNYGPSSDSSEIDDSYPFEFEVNLAIRDKNVILTDIITLKVDNSSFYE